MKYLSLILAVVSLIFVSDPAFAKKSKKQKNTRKVTCKKGYKLKGNKKGFYCQGSKTVGKYDTKKVKCPVGTKHQSKKGRDNCKGLWDTRKVHCKGLFGRKAKGKVTIMNDQWGNDDACVFEKGSEKRYKKPKWKKV